MNAQVRVRALAVAASAVAAAVLVPLAAADATYHTEHLNLTPVGAAPLRSGFVQNIKAEGPQVYARELFLLDGAAPNATYTVTRHLFVQDPACDGGLVFPSRVAVLATNAAGNANADAIVTPGEVAGFEGVHGVMWTVQDAAGSVAYRTACTAVTLD